MSSPGLLEEEGRSCSCPSAPGRATPVSAEGIFTSFSTVSGSSPGLDMPLAVVLDGSRKAEGQEETPGKRVWVAVQLLHWSEVRLYKRAAEW